MVHFYLLFFILFFDAIITRKSLSVEDGEARDIAEEASLGTIAVPFA
jgi:hypothetical protein